MIFKSDILKLFSKYPKNIKPSSLSICLDASFFSKISRHNDPPIRRHYILKVALKGRAYCYWPVFVCLGGGVSTDPLTDVSKSSMNNSFCVQGTRSLGWAFISKTPEWPMSNSCRVHFSSALKVSGVTSTPKCSVMTHLKCLCYPTNAIPFCDDNELSMF